MRQGNGTELLGANDPQAASIGIIYVSPNDDRKSVLAAILTQEKLNREQVVIELPAANKAFSRPQDFDDLKSIRRKLHAQIIFVAPDGPGPAEFAHQRRFPVFSSLDSYKQSLVGKGRSRSEENEGKRPRLFGARSKSSPASTAGAAAAGAAAGAMAADAFSAADQQTITPAAYQTLQPPSRSLFDDDDDALEDPSAPMSNRGARSFRQPPTLQQMPIEDEGDGEDDWDAMGTNAARLTPPPPSGDLPDEPEMADPEFTDEARIVDSHIVPQNDEDEEIDPDESEEGNPGIGIIDLKPLRQRNTINLNESPAASNIPQTPVAPPVEQPTPPTRGAINRRRSGSIAGAAAVGAAAGALGAGALAAGNRTNTGPTGTGKNAAVVPATPPSNTPPSWSPPPGRGNKNTGGNGNRPTAGKILLVLLILLILTSFIGCIALAAFNQHGFQTLVVQPASKIIPGIASAPPATVTITPASKVVQNNYAILAVAGKANADQLQVSMRSLSATPQSQSKQVTGTGHTQTAATEATGTLTFINGSTNTYTVGANTAIPTSSGVSVEPDGPVTIPGRVGTVVGQKTASAHAVTAGTAGNVAAGTVQGTCCSTSGNISVTNSAFSGGKDPQNYTFVQQSDVNSVAQPIEATLQKEALNQFNQQLKSNESLVSNPSCTSTVNATPNTVGNQGANIPSTQITVSAKCTGVAYDRTAAQSLTQTRLQTEAKTAPGPGYALVGNVVTNITQVQQHNQSISLLTSAHGVWAYQFSDTLKQQLAKEIAGKTVADAQALLKSQQGIANVQIKINGSGDTLPSNPTQITFDVQSVQGATGSGNNTTTPTLTPTTNVVQGKE
ncbi:MAG TPA: hypothetical protein VL461_04000 [Dictyobacter sp.]|jgi:hypothetical protein|nr:hypothetical protein [Dictyobacter sp.]